MQVIFSFAGDPGEMVSEFHRAGGPAKEKGSAAARRGQGVLTEASWFLSGRLSRPVKKASFPSGTVPEGKLRALRAAMGALR